MATPTTTETRRDEEDERRRKRALALIADIRRRLDMVCPQIQRIDRGADLVSDIIDKSRQLAAVTGAKDLLPRAIRDDLAHAADRFERWRTRVGDAAGLCERLYGALDEAEQILARAAPPQEQNLLRRHWKGVLGTVAVAALVAAGILVALLWDDDEDQDVTIDEPAVTSVSTDDQAAAPEGELLADLVASLDVGRGIERGNRIALVPVTVTVTNVGDADAGGFSVAVWERGANGKLLNVPFRAEGFGQLAAPFVDGLAAGESVTLTGRAALPDTSTDFGPATLLAEADSCLGKAGSCMVEEADEANNLSDPAETGRIIG